MRNSDKVTEIQLKLVNAGWLEGYALQEYGEFGKMGSLTYMAIYNVQCFYNENCTDGNLMTYVLDDSGNPREVDELTYDYILNHLPMKPM